MTTGLGDNKPLLWKRRLPVTKMIAVKKGTKGFQWLTCSMRSSLQEAGLFVDVLIFCKQVDDK